MFRMTLCFNILLYWQLLLINCWGSLQLKSYRDISTTRTTLASDWLIPRDWSQHRGEDYALPLGTPLFKYISARAGSTIKASSSICQGSLPATRQHRQLGCEIIVKRRQECSFHVVWVAAKPPCGIRRVQTAKQLSMCGQYRRSLPGLHVLPVLVDAGKILYMNTIHVYSTLI